MSLMVTGKPLQNEFVRPCLGQDAIADLAVGLLVHLLQSRGVFTLGLFLPLLRLRQLCKHVTLLQLFSNKTFTKDQCTGLVGKEPVWTVSPHGL